MSAVAVSFGVVFLAEMGDKSQLMALAFAHRYRLWTVLGAIATATATVHLASVAAGTAMVPYLSPDGLTVLTGAAFLAFAAWTLRGDRLSAEDEDRVARRRRSAFLAVGLAFFLAELGDKTMFATVTVAASEGWFGTWIGSTAGMVAADALAIGLGVALGRRLPARALRLGSAGVFFTSGLALLAAAAA